jgi:hypothetical protein
MKLLILGRGKTESLVAEVAAGIFLAFSAAFLSDLCG